MNVSLPDDLVEFVRGELNGGGYGNQSDVVRDGLRLLREQKQKRRVLLRLLDESDVAIAAGKTSELTDDLLVSITTTRASKKKSKSRRS